MISVTAAAHFRRGGSSASGNSSQRHPFGAHFKAYGSGRIALSGPYEAEEFLTEKHSFLERCGDKQKGNSIPGPEYSNSPILLNVILLLKFMAKLCSLLFSIISQLFPFFVAASSGYHERGNLNSPLKLRKREENGCNAVSAFNKLPDNVVSDIFRWTTASDLLRAKGACNRLGSLIDLHADELPKLLIDQVKLHFDEGEVIIYPLDERSTPTRHSMPHAEVEEKNFFWGKHLESRLRHICTLSLFIRGLIPMETAPVLRRLSRVSIRPSQLYFLWCDFDAKCAEDCLVHLINANQSSLTDIGFEVCTPVSLISDAFFARVDLRRLVSIRVWNGGYGDRENCVAMQKSVRECEAIVDGGETAVTDRFLYELARLYAICGSQLETIDLAGVDCSGNGLLALIIAWYRRPPVNHLHIGFHRSVDAGGSQAAALSVELLTRCEAIGVPLTTHGLCHPNGHRLSLFIT